MGVKGMTRIMVVGLLALSGGCGERLVDRASIGLAVREMKGGYRGFKVQTVMPVYEVQAKSKLAVNDDLDIYVRGQFGQGEVEAHHQILGGKGEGNFSGIGVGLNYFPFDTCWLGFGLGAEVYRADYRMRGWYGPISQATADRFWGGGANFGMTGEVLMAGNDKRRLVWGAGCNFTKTSSHKAEVDLDGWYGTIALGIDLPRN